MGLLLVACPNIVVFASLSVVAGLGSACLIGRHCWRALDRPGDGQGRLIYALEITSDLENGYLFVLGRWLGLLDRWMGAPAISARSERGAACFTASSFDSTLKACLLSPVIGLLITWFLTGDAGILGSTVGLPRYAALIMRVVSGASMLAAGLSFGRAWDEQTRRAGLWIAVGLLIAAVGDEIAGALDPTSQQVLSVNDGSFLGSVALGSMVVLSLRLTGARVLGLAAVRIVAVAVVGNGPAIDLLPFCGAFALVQKADRSPRSATLWSWAWPMGLATVVTLLAGETVLDTPGRGRVALAFLDAMPLAIIPLVWLVWEAARWVLGRAGQRDGPAPITAALVVFLLGGAGSLLLAGGAQLIGFSCGVAPILAWGDMAAWSGHICVSPSIQWPAVVGVPILMPLFPVLTNIVLATAAVVLRLISERRRMDLIRAVQTLHHDDRRSRRRIIAVIVVRSFAAAFIGCGGVLVACLSLIRIGPNLTLALLGLVITQR
jgi:hypothetical protein